jgi:hypothetical protein
MANFSRPNYDNGVTGWSKPYSGSMSGGGGNGGGGSGKAGLLGKGPTAAPAGQFFGTPATTFPQYTSGAWANLPTGTITPPQPTTPTPPPATPQTPNSPLSGLFGSNGQFDWRAYLKTLGINV